MGRPPHTGSERVPGSFVETRQNLGPSPSQSHPEQGMERTITTDYIPVVDEAVFFRYYTHKPCPHGTFFGKTYGDRCQFDKIKSNADSR